MLTAGLAGLDPADLAGVARFLLTHCPKDREFSLCEVRLCDEDREWLLRWPGQAKAATVEQLLGLENVDPARGHSPSEALALVVLWFAALYGRESASEGEIWTQVAPQFPEPTRKALFSQGHPRQSLKWALERCCRRFRLRNGFGRQGGQAYYLTVYLQFGFTRRALDHLHDWLSGAPVPTAVATLLHDSPEFRQLWEGLKSGVASASLSSNPFWPRGWSGRFEESGHLARLCWTNSGARFQVDLRRCFPALPDGSYQLEGPDGLWEWLQVSDGVYVPDAVDLNPSQCDCKLSLSNLDHDAVLQECEVVLWPVDVPCWWDAGGKSSECAPQSGWSVLLPPGWSVRNGVAASEVVGPARNLLVRVVGASFEVVDEDGAIVDLKPVSHSPINLRLQWDGDVLRFLPCGVAGVLSGIPDGYDAVLPECEGVPYCGMVEVRQQAPASLARAELGVRVQLRGEERRLTRTVKAPVQLDLITWQRESEWATFQDCGELDLTVLRQARVRYFGDSAAFGVLEGDVFVGRPSGLRGLPVSGMSGYGAPVRLRRGPYNSEGIKERQLVGSLVNCGLCERIEIRDNEYELSLRRPIWPGEKFFLLFWDGASSVIAQRLSQGPEQIRALRGTLPLETVFAIGLGFGTTRQGAILTRQRPPLQQPNSALAARLMRWLQMPLMSWTWRSLAAAWMKGQELPYFRTWLTESSFKVDDVELDFVEDEGWFDVMRQFVPAEIGWTAKEAQEVLRHSWRWCLRVGPDFLRQLLERGDCVQERRWICQQLTGALGRYADLAEKAAAEMGVDRRWLERLGEMHWAGESSADLRVALTQGAFQEWLFVEGVR